tara:strand:+ start:1984 stop:3057 length:1074 start_codon:yes stop_codon:yes gene_type:complete
MENLIVESIEIYGQDIYYLPRTYVNRDTILNEIENSTFTQALEVRAYVNNVEGWEGQGELLTKFGIRIEDKTTFIFSRKKFEEKVDDNAVLNVEGRPNEGDLIWFPITKHLFEIKFVEVERPFYQLGKGYVWECQCELFEYADEQLDTGVAEIDAIETSFANSIKLVMDAGGSGDFTVGEEIVGDLYRAAATATIDSGAVDAITITDGGEHYKSALPPTVTFSAAPEGGTTATGTAVVSSAGIVTGITITEAGAGYTTAPTVTIDYSPKDSRAEVKSWNSGTRELQIINRSGTFNTSETIKGITSGALWSPESYNTLNNTNSNFDQNSNYETEDDDILDFTEVNPFGTIGSTTDTAI